MKKLLALLLMTGVMAGVPSVSRAGIALPDQKPAQTGPDAGGSVSQNPPDANDVGDEGYGMPMDGMPDFAARGMLDGHHRDMYDAEGGHGMRGGHSGFGRGHCEGPGRMDDDVMGMDGPLMRSSCRMPADLLSMRTELNLSDYQIDSIKKLQSAMTRERTLKGAAVKVFEMDLSDIVSNAEFKQDEALSKLKEIEKARTELRTVVIKASAAARDVLSPAQLEKLKEIDRGNIPAGHDAMPEGRPSMMKRMMMDRMKR